MSRYGSQNSLTDIDNNTCDNPSPNPSPKPPHVSQKTNLETIKQHSVSNPDLLDGKDNGASPPNTQLLANSDSTKQFVRHSSCPTSRRTSTNSQGELAKLEFEVTDFFMFGSPLALVLAYRKLFYGNEKISKYQRGYKQINKLVARDLFQGFKVQILNFSEFLLLQVY